MRAMPDPPRADHPDAVNALQRWIWQCSLAGWQPGGDLAPHWSHDDNMAVQHLGWMISAPPGSKIPDLFSLRPGGDTKSIMAGIVGAAAIDPLCAKAVAVFSKHRMLNPEHKFSFDK